MLPFTSGDGLLAVQGGNLSPFLGDCHMAHSSPEIVAQEKLSSLEAWLDKLCVCGGRVLDKLS